MEYLIPLANVQQAISAIRAALAASGFYPNTPVYLRFAGGGSDADLGPMNGGPVTAIEVLSYVRFTGWEAFFRDLEPRWRALGGRPHWGKLFYANPADLYDPTARAHFRAVRDQFDPHHKFGNALVDSILDAP
jgi:L-gulonolactone oxidase